MAAIMDLQTSFVVDTSPLLFFVGQNRQREYVSGRISDEVVVFIILFRFMGAILNISISPRVPEWHEPDYQYIGHVVSKTFIKHWVDTNARSTPKSLFGCKTISSRSPPILAVVFLVF